MVMWRKLWVENGGNVAMIAALILPLLLGFGGAGVDFIRWNAQRQNLQEFADSLALLGARELLVAKANKATILNLLTATVEGRLAEKFDAQDAQYEFSVDLENASVTVQLRQAPKSALVLGSFRPFNQGFTSNATASASGAANVCVVALSGGSEKAISGVFSAKLSADDCAIYSNSVSATGVSVTGSAKIIAKSICSAGGFEGSDRNFDPLPGMDCPPVPDPLIHRVAPSVSMCDYLDTELGEQDRAVTRDAVRGSIQEFIAKISPDKASEMTVDRDYEEYTIDPGVYCGGISIASNSDVTFRPGVYIMKDGPLKVNLGAKVTGEGVGIYLTGNDANFHFGADSKVSLSAPEDGLMAGILFFEDRQASAGQVHKILSDDARILLGTIYLSKGTLEVASLFPVADQSAYTAIVVNQLKLAGSPTLVLNTDYAATQVPVPDGLGPTGGQIRLRK